jgi:hypothetical protein
MYAADVLFKFERRAVKGISVLAAVVPPRTGVRDLKLA